MGAVILLAAALGLAVYGGLLSLPAFSPRRDLVRRLGARPVTPSAPRRLPRLGTPLEERLRRVPATRRLPALRFRQGQALLAGGAALALVLPWLLLDRPVDLAALLFYPAALWLLPEAWLWLQVRRRTALIAKAYPDLLAHLVAQTRAGASTIQAFTSSPPVLREPLRGEVEDLIADMRIAPFPAALERFGERCGVADIRAFAQNVIYQQSLGVALPDVLAAEEAHMLALARQAMRRRIQAAAVTMAAVTVILLMNGLIIYFTPVAYDLTRLLSQR